MNTGRCVRILTTVLMVVPIAVFAQSDGTVPPPEQKPVDQTAQDPAPAPADSSTAQTTGSAASPQGTPAETGTQIPSTTTPTAAPTGGGSVRPTTPASTGTTIPTSVPTATTTPDAVPLETVSAAEDSGGGNPWLWPLAVVLAVIPFGFVIAGWMKKKPKQRDESNNRCFDIRQMMEKKLKELTDVQAMIKEKVKEKTKEAMRESVEGTATGDLLVRAQKLEEQYKKLKALYEECKIDVDRYKLKGVLVENSLSDKKILEHLRVIRTRIEGDRVLHDIRLSTSQIDDIQKDIIDNSWYFHLWEPGKDTVTVVFKDKIFTIKHSDKATWHDAIAHGIANGIPEDRLDFTIMK